MIVFAQPIKHLDGINGLDTGTLLKKINGITSIISEGLKWSLQFIEKQSNPRTKKTLEQEQDELEAIENWNWYVGNDREIREKVVGIAIMKLIETVIREEQEQERQFERAS